MAILCNRFVKKPSLGGSITEAVTEIDDISVSYARNNVALNHLEDRIEILQVQPDDCIFPTAVFE